MSPFLHLQGRNLKFRCVASQLFSDFHFLFGSGWRLTPPPPETHILILSTNYSTVDRLLLFSISFSVIVCSCSERKCAGGLGGGGDCTVWTSPSFCPCISPKDSQHSASGLFNFSLILWLITDEQSSISLYGRAASCVPCRCLTA